MGSEFDAIEARFFTTCLRTDREPATCIVCSKLIEDCQCSISELLAWLRQHDRLRG